MQYTKYLKGCEDMTPTEKYNEFLTKYATARGISKAEAGTHVQAKVTKEYYDTHTEFEKQIHREVEQTLCNITH